MEPNRLLDIYYYVDDRGNRPVEVFIRSLPVKERSRILAYIYELKKEGNNLRRPMADYLRGGIYELRPRRNRLFYFFYLRDSVVLVHAIIKLTTEIPQNDLNLCLRRKNQVQNEGGHIEKLGLRGDLNGQD